MLDAFRHRETGLVHEIVREDEPHISFRLRCMGWPQGITEGDFVFEKVTCLMCLDGFDFHARRHDATCVTQCCHTDPTTKCPSMHHCWCGKTD